MIKPKPSRQNMLFQNDFFLCEFPQIPTNSRFFWEMVGTFPAFLRTLRPGECSWRKKKIKSYLHSKRNLSPKEPETLEVGLSPSLEHPGCLPPFVPGCLDAGNSFGIKKVDLLIRTKIEEI